MALGLAPYDLWYLGLAGLIAAFWLFASAPKGLYAVGTGWGVGLGYFGVSLGWIVEPFMVDAAVTGWMAPFAQFGMAGGLALFWGLASILTVLALVELSMSVASLACIWCMLVTPDYCTGKLKISLNGDKNTQRE